MTKKTPAQRIAELELALQRAKTQQRKARTKRLIELGAVVEKEIGAGSEVTIENARDLIRFAHALKDFGHLILELPAKDQENLKNALKHQLAKQQLPPSAHNA